MFTIHFIYIQFISSLFSFQIFALLDISFFNFPNYYIVASILLETKDKENALVNIPNDGQWISLSFLQIELQQMCNTGVDRQHFMICLLLIFI